MPLRTLTLFVLPALMLIAGPAIAQDDDASPRNWARQHLDDIVKLYREFHASPELSFHEEETAERMATQLREAGWNVTQSVGGHGVVAQLTNGDGPTLMLRTDLDALPVTEQTNLVYASKVTVENETGGQVGVMHACGHDVHIANIIGVGRYLAAHRDQWQGTIMIIGQPAEERGAGARAMLEDGLFEKFPKPDYAVALHVDSTLPTGQVGYRGGYALANVDSVDITVHGRGGHGAFPHTTLDPIVQASQLVLALQTIVSREVNPLEPAVVTVGSIHGGTKHNIIGNDCHLQITVRSYSDQVRQQILDAIRRKAKGVALSANAPEPTIEVSEGTPSLFNDEELAARLASVFKRVVGEDNVVLSEQSMGGEDFSQYGRAGVPILMYRLGAVDAKRLERYKQLGQQPPSLHSPLFYPDVEDALVTGIGTMAAAAIELLPPKDQD